MRINEPAVLAELMQCHERYEKALLANDADVLDGLFWNSPHSHGAGEIHLARDIQKIEITAFGDSAGIVSLELKHLGRETRFWIRFDEGWQIASAHVSLFSPAPRSSEATYVDATANEIGLRIAAENKAGVEDHLSRLAAIAGFLMEFPLSQDVEAAPVFRP
jgi:hypothetical protein